MGGIAHAVILFDLEIHEVLIGLRQRHPQIMLTGLRYRKIDDALEQRLLLLDLLFLFHAEIGRMNAHGAIIRNVLDQQAVIAVSRRNVLVIGPVFAEKKKEQGSDAVLLSQGHQLVVNVVRVFVQAKNNQKSHPKLPDIEL